MRGRVRLLLGVVAGSLLGWSHQAQAQSASPEAPRPAPSALEEPSAAAAAPVAPLATAPPAAAPPAAVPAQRAAPTRFATVRFEADHPDAVLESDWSPSGGNVPLYMICSTPCETRVSADAHYRVAGPGLYDSTIFGLPPGRERVSVKAEMETKSVAGPVLLLVLGGTAFSIVGPILLVAGVEANRRHKDGDGLIVSGAVVTGSGAVLGLIGLVSLVLKASRSESKVHVARAAVPALALPAAASR